MAEVEDKDNMMIMKIREIATQATNKQAEAMGFTEIVIEMIMITMLEEDIKETKIEVANMKATE